MSKKIKKMKVRKKLGLFERIQIWIKAKRTLEEDFEKRVVLNEDVYLSKYMQDVLKDYINLRNKITNGLHIRLDCELEKDFIDCNTKSCEKRNCDKNLKNFKELISRVNDEILSQESNLEKITATYKEFERRTTWNIENTDQENFLLMYRKDLDNAKSDYMNKEREIKLKIEKLLEIKVRHFYSMQFDLEEHYFLFGKKLETYWSYIVKERKAFPPLLKENHFLLFAINESFMGEPFQKDFIDSVAYIKDISNCREI